MKNNSKNKLKQKRRPLALNDGGWKGTKADSWIVLTSYLSPASLSHVSTLRQYGDIDGMTGVRENWYRYTTSFSKFCFFTENLGCGGSAGAAGAASFSSFFSSVVGFLSFASCLLFASAAASPAASFIGSLTSCGTFFVSSVVAVVMMPSDWTLIGCTLLLSDGCGW